MSKALPKLLFCLSSLVACATAVPPATTVATTAAIRVGSTGSAPAPAPGAVTRTTVYESPRTVTQVLRLAPNSAIAEHHHPFYDETFTVVQGRVALTLNGTPYTISAGDFIVMPAGTVITGSNADAGESRVVVAFSSTGTPGPLSVSGGGLH
jgi:quercetin dioxygenase-like cupin family protein